MDMPSLKRRLCIEEGDKLVAYLDTKGILTVGTGHNCVARPVDGVTQPGDRITPEQDQALFEADVQDACDQLDNYLSWWRNLDDARQNVILDMCFNMGIAKLMGFHHTLASVKGGIDDPALFSQAADEMKDSAWHDQVGSRAVFLENAMRTGIYA